VHIVAALDAVKAAENGGRIGAGRDRIEPAARRGSRTGARADRRAPGAVGEIVEPRVAEILACVEPHEKNVEMHGRKGEQTAIEFNSEKGQGTQTASRTGAVVTLRAGRELATKHKERTARADAAEKHGVRH
jgi:hypothetical protein